MGFFEIFNDCATQPLLTVSASKGIKIKESLVLIFSEDIRLKYFCEISDWIINDWFPYVKEFPMSKIVPTNDDISSEAINDNMNDKELSNEECDESISYFTGSEEQILNDSENKNESIDNAIECSTKKADRKSLFGSPSEDTLFTLLPALNSFADQITHLLPANKFDYVLDGKINNDPINNRFIINRHLGGNRLALDMSTFSHNEPTLSLHLIGQLCANVDGRDNKTLHK